MPSGPDQAGRPDGLRPEPAPDLVDRPGWRVPRRRRPASVVERQLPGRAAREARARSRRAAAPRAPGRRRPSSPLADGGDGRPAVERVGHRRRPGDGAEVGNRTLTVTVRPASPWRRSRAATASAMRTTSAPSSSRVVEVPGERLLVADRLQPAGRVRPPGRRCPGPERCRWRPLAWPSAWTSVASGRAARSPTVTTPRRRSRSQRGRTDAPQRLHRERVQERQLLAGRRPPSRRRPGATPAGPALGLAASDASLARNLVGATPTEHVRPSSSGPAGRMASGDLGAVDRAAAARRSRRGRPRRGRSARRAA